MPDVASRALLQGSHTASAAPADPALTVRRHIDLMRVATSCCR